MGDTVRIVDFGKRKSSLTKGFKQSWSKELYTIFKIKRPKKSESTRPIKFYVKNKEGNERKDANDRLIPYTINDLQKINSGVEKAPDTVRLDKTPPPSPVSTPKPKPMKKEPPPKKQHKYIGLKIKTDQDDNDEGEVIEVFTKKVSGKRKQYVKIRWKQPVKKDKQGNDVFTQDQPISNINAYVKSLAE